MLNSAQTQAKLGRDGSNFRHHITKLGGNDQLGLLLGLIIRPNQTQTWNSDLVIRHGTQTQNSDFGLTLVSTNISTDISTDITADILNNITTDISADITNDIAADFQLILQLAF